jgi:hypothetical protein
MRKILISCCVILLLISASIALSQSGGKTLDPSYKKIDVSDPLSSLSSSIQSELSSAVAAPSTPLILKGVAQAFPVMGVCCSGGTVALCGQIVDINWYNKPATVDLSKFNTLTVTFSSLPPGPANWCLMLGGHTIDKYSIDNTSVVLDVTTCPDCFSGTSALYDQFYIGQVESWTTAPAS